MDKNAIKKYAVWARRELIEKVSQKALQYGIEEGKELDPKLESINGVLLSDVERKQRQALIRRINDNGYTKVIEEVAYTWFNRFIALRFMEVNGYLPSHVRVFTNEEGEFQPQIMSEALHLDIDGLNMDTVYELKNENKDDELFRYLLITQCNALSGIFPKMFQKIADYTELLLPDYLLREGSVIEQMVNQNEGIPENDWQDQVQIIGWLYQYYNTEPKDKVFSDLKKNIKITKETIPAATQLFTPDWVVHYMVENSLGRLWLDGHQGSIKKSEWKYYIDEAEQESDVQKKLVEIRESFSIKMPEEIRCIDPCMGSGHILCVLFDTLVAIYEDYGYSARDAAISIVERNLWGLDIDERAAQLAYFAVMMKARQYDRRFLTRGIQPHVYAIDESNGLDYDGDYGDFLVNTEHQNTLKYIFKAFKDAKEYGSIIDVEDRDYDGFIRDWNAVAEQTLGDVRMIGWYMYAVDRINSLAYQAKALSQKYDVVVTNPPYMGNGGMDSVLSEFVKAQYPDTKSDLSTVFMEKCLAMCKPEGYVSMINIPVWMFLSSYEKLRYKILNNNTYINMLHFGRGVFGSDFGTTAFVLNKRRIQDYKASYYKLFEKQGAVDALETKLKWFMERRGLFIEKQENYLSIPGVPVAYSLGNVLLKAFAANNLVSSVADVKQGLATGDNNRFLRYWWEVSNTKILFDATNSESALASKKKWFPYNKGGAYRKWYGNIEYVVNWENDGYEIKNIRNDKGKLRSRPQNLQYFFREALTWSKVTIGGFSMRYVPSGAVFDVAGCSLFPHNNIFVMLANMNSCVQKHILSVFSQSVNYEVGQIAALPIIEDEQYREEIESLSRGCVSISEQEWNSYETAWGFDRHPIVNPNNQDSLLSVLYNNWEAQCQKQFTLLKNNEERLNDIFINIYGLKNELKPSVEDKDVTYRRAEVEREVRSLISYAVGCMFGRYSLDSQGLVFAGGTWDESKYVRFKPDKDAIIPICDDEYFEDDIVERLIAFIEIVYGKSTLEENLQFIADTLGGNGSAREVIRNYFINDFYADHLKIYQKRPIYWLFDSGKKNGFKCLIYMHRYQPDTIARIRTDYVHEQQARYRTAIEETTNRIESANGSDKVKLTKKLNTLKAQDEEIHAYEEKIHHLADQMISIDLDDGVKHNYEIFKDVLAKIK